MLAAGHRLRDRDRVRRCPRASDARGAFGDQLARGRDRCRRVGLLVRIFKLDGQLDPILFERFVGLVDGGLLEALRGGDEEGVEALIRTTCAALPERSRVQGEDAR